MSSKAMENTDKSFNSTDVAPRFPNIVKHVQGCTGNCGDTFA